MRQPLTLLAALVALLATCDAARVLVFLPGTTPMERQHLEMLAQYLAHANHKVGAVKAIIIPEEKRLVKHRLHEVREMTLGADVDRDTLRTLDTVRHTVWEGSYSRATESAQSVRHAADRQACDTMLNSDLMDRIKEGDYEVALVYKGQPCHAAVVHALRIPWIYYDPTGFSDEMHVVSGYSWPAGHIPSSRSELAQPLTFADRLHNTAFWLTEYAANSGIPVLGKLFSSRYSELDSPVNQMFQTDYELQKVHENFPPVEDIKKKATLYFVNWDPALEFSWRQTSSNVIYVGGYHMEPAKPMFERWNDTVHSALDGLIICSFGNQAALSSMPPAALRALFAAFAALDRHRVIVYTDSVELNVTVPDNVNVTRYLPQRDLFATRRVKLLISNGGAHSLIEAATHGTPVLAVPLAGADHSNAAKLQRHGLAHVVSKERFLAMDALQMRAAMAHVLHDARYELAARRFAREHGRRPLGPFDTVLYWLEKVADTRRTAVLTDAERQGGHALPLPVWCYTGLDVVAIALLLPLSLWKTAALLLSKTQPRRELHKAAKESKELEEKKNDNTCKKSEKKTGQPATSS